MKVIKANGEKEDFKRWKIEKSIIKAGILEDDAREISKKVSKKIYNNITTKEILKIVFDLLKKYPLIKKRYNLKRAIMSLGPAGFVFEEFFSQILRNYGYKTKTDLIMKGKATTQEVDILAKREKVYMIECKYHNKNGISSDSKVAMYTYARFLDLSNNPKNKIDFGWLVTNTKCTAHALEYAKGVGLKITSWNYASFGDFNLQELIKNKNLYPVTILNSVKGRIRDLLLNKKIVLVKTFVDNDLIFLKNKTGLKLKELKKIKKEAEEFIIGNV